MRLGCNLPKVVIVCNLFVLGHLTELAGPADYTCYCGPTNQPTNLPNYVPRQKPRFCTALYFLNFTMNFLVACLVILVKHVEKLEIVENDVTPQVLACKHLPTELLASPGERAGMLTQVGFC